MESTSAAQKNWESKAYYRNWKEEKFSEKAGNGYSGEMTENLDRQTFQDSAALSFQHSKVNGHVGGEQD
jgi:hypothetical protein